MCKKLIYLAFPILVLSVASNVQAALEPFSLQPAHDAHVGNDAQLGPEANDGSRSAMYFRDIEPRRRVSFVSYDISELQSEQCFFSDACFSNYGHDSGTVLVYRVIEELDEIDETTITWNNAPGVQNNPAPPMGDPVALDYNDLTPLLYQFTSPARGVRESTEPSREFSDFLNSDTDGIVTFLFAPIKGQGYGIVRTKELEDDVGGTFLEGLVNQPPRAIAINPTNGQTEVPRDVILSWRPVELAETHDVYFGTNIDEVSAADRNNPLSVLVGQDLVTAEYDPGRLEFGQTYYWRVDGVSADLTIFKGIVWSFTVEPYALPIPGEAIIATADSNAPGQGPENTVNGSGLDDNDRHSTEFKTMWLSDDSESGSSWIQYEFDKTYKLHEMLVWNFNGEIFLIFFGVKDVTVEYSIDGMNWMRISSVTEFAQALGADDYAPNTTVDFDGVVVKHVRITPNSTWGGPALRQFGLSEVRFMHIPVRAREPSPDSEATGLDVDVTLVWRAGREAAEHNVYISTDGQSVIDGIAPAVSVSEACYGPLSLDLGEFYYWRVDEVNEAEIPTMWPGDIWNFSTVEYFVVDDFEGYAHDEPNRIFDTWKNGLGDPLNGATVVEERLIVHSGRRSMALIFDNSNTEGISEVTVKMSDLKIGRDWTRGVPEKLVFWIYGDPENVITEQLYLNVNGAKYNCDIDRLALTKETWTQVTVDLVPSSMNLTDVDELRIGFIRDALTTGKGIVFIDDIRLYRQAPLLPEE